ncbi:haloacid dehalogenase superfamily, subfamily IA, variant 3 with third motif having DD or ED [Klenkia soli]|uniref:Haloacid dehalogenase superfamily, subfamily IA, variant 3 with third motif having DD or ED n=1 Tax=Klenkia soli TaxID=1052260 RepID=A0A1H0PGV3_9ACTN|nr:HAD-IA family hydrolase [Klenkia soli]SDP04297.1 haloacid dehalogenase superfamily, subfamily IA, variant 3 with third motif having DD or ED [Klenkia soli]
MSALLFGSISTIADTSELQRESFNEAFAAHDLDWRWETDEYREMLRGNGGADRIAGYAADRGQDVDAAAVHATKSELFQQKLGRGGLTARPGVLESLRSAKQAGGKVALVTTTSPENVVALVQGVDELSLSDFDLVVDSSVVSTSKPDPAAYAYALQTLGEDAAEAVAVEDNVGGVESATAAGVTCLAFPNTNTAGHDFGAARVVDRLDPADLPTGLQA